MEELQHNHDTTRNGNASNERGDGHGRDMHDRRYTTTTTATTTATSPTANFVTSTHIPPTSNRFQSENVMIPFSSSAGTTTTTSRNYDSREAQGEPPLQCCCGRRDCAYLRHNNVALGDLEKDLETAARLGQALLQRHETYVSEAEADRSQLLLEMERLERDKQEIQSANARIVEENRQLLEQLEGLNNAVATSDTQIKTLADRLQQTQLEMRALAASAARAAELECQLNAMETEQMELQQQLILTQEDEKSAVQRWKKAETTLRDLQDQLDRLEYEARMEREEHAQIIERMERRRAVERELDGAAGRLKGAAAASAVMDRNRTATTPVVSKFVRDILQDNANLQMGIVELRELLESSNQEVENLREQIMHHHQPVNAESDQQPRPHVSRLDQELNAKEPRPVSQEFHVHHHYHSPSSSISSKKEKQPVRRQKKRRPTLVASGMHSPRASTYHRAHPSSSSVSTIMSQTSVSIPPSSSSSSQRFSVHPSGVSSLASSPISAYQPSSIFDVVDQSELSRPSSPESTTAMLTSPKRPMWKGHRWSDASNRSFSMPGMGSSFADFDSENDNDIGDDGMEQPPMKTSDEMRLPPAIPEEQEDTVDKEKHVDQSVLEQTDVTGPSMLDNVLDTSFDPVHTLRKSSSYESLLSVSGMDIHTLRERPSQLLLGGFESRYFNPRRPPQRVVTVATEISSTPPVISTTNITADKAIVLSNSQPKSSHSLLASVVARSKTSTPAPSTNAANADSMTKTKPPANITRKVGGWVMGKWGIAPSPSPSSSPSSPSVLTADNLRQQLLQAPPPQSDTASISSETTTSTTTTTTNKSRSTTTTPKPIIRGFGINQKGPIPGFVASTLLPAKQVVLQPRVLDRELLDESLRE